MSDELERDEFNREMDKIMAWINSLPDECKELARLRRVNAKLVEALGYYACPALCTEQRLKDGTCIRELSGLCGKEARAAIRSATEKGEP